MARAYIPGPLALALQLAIGSDRELEEAYDACPCEDHAVDACPHLAAARDALRDSDEPRPWELSEGGYHYDTVLASSVEEAMDLARDGVDRANYDGDCDRGTLYVGVRVGCRLTGEEDSDRVTLDPEEPACADGHAHDWQAPHDLVGGLKENPGVWGHGGGIITTRVCTHCGCACVTDTWSQDRETGEQGLSSVEYHPGRYADEVAALTESEDES